MLQVDLHLNLIQFLIFIPVSMLLAVLMKNFPGKVLAKCDIN